MKNTNINNVEVNNVNRERSKHNLDHDVNTTASLGTIQPLGFMEMFPHDKVSFKPSTLIRAGAMVVPSWAKFKWMLSSAFVPIKSVFPNYDFFASGTYKRTATGKLSINTFPWITTAQLTALCCCGARMSIWLNSVGSPSVSANDYVKATPSSSSVLKDIINAVRNNPSLSTVSAGQLDLFPKHSGIAFNASFLWNSGIGWDNNVNVKQVWLPLGNTPKSLVGTGVMWDDVFYGSEDISPSNADFVIETEKYESSEPLNRNYAICFRLSDKGKLFAKLLRGLGYNLDFRADTADDRVSILPLLAWYRAYFRFNGIERLRNWESTYCHQLINWIETNGDSVCDFGLTSSQWAAPKTSTSSAPISIFMSSDYQAGDGKPDGSYATSYYTPQWLESQIKLVNSAINAYGGNRQGTGVEGTTGHTLGIDGDGAGNMYDIQTTIFSQGSLVGFQATAKDGGLSANLVEALKRLQRVTSKHDVFGQNVRALMKAFGIDGYDTDEPVDVLGFRSFDLNISEVTSLADTYANSITGRYLGEQAGKSVTTGDDDYSKPIVCSTDERGFFFVMGGIVPISGYVNMADEHNYMVHRSQQYDKEFEGLGYDATRMERLFGDIRVSNKTSTIKKHAFGFVPRYSALKVKHNVLNGDFNRPAMRDALLPYSSDRNISLMQPNGDVKQIIDAVNVGTIYESTFNRFYNDFSKLPLAGKEWAYYYKYGFMGWLNRMFVNTDPIGSVNYFGVTSSQIPNEWIIDTYDNFIVHTRVFMDLESEMLPIAATYQTQDDSAKANETLSLS
ncbi:unnamed protein product [Cylicocyclus nassatus]|uniref:Major capsid protein n=1 Tax=Cylicocyclus nassatus TaxID=53992 RepID=A0AA36DS38_CYLNA|nr:unnamed protein product [Cylicocyclus nassatus]